jgi:hypothetical protein
MSLYFFANLCHSSKSLNSNISFPTNIHLSFHLDCSKKIVYFSLYYDCFLFYNNSSTISCNSFSCATRPTYIIACLIFASLYLFDICTYYYYVSSCLLSYIYKIMQKWNCKKMKLKMLETKLMQIAQNN